MMNIHLLVTQVLNILLTQHIGEQFQHRRTLFHLCFLLCQVSQHVMALNEQEEWISSCVHSLVC